MIDVHLEKVKAVPRVPNVGLNRIQFLFELFVENSYSDRSGSTPVMNLDFCSFTFATIRPKFSIIKKTLNFNKVHSFSF